MMTTMALPLKTRIQILGSSSNDDLDDFDFDEFDKEFEEESSNESQKDKKKEYYVKKADLVAEIQKYQDSKKNDPNGRGKVSEELRSYDHEDLHQILASSKILWIYIQRRFCLGSHHPLHFSLPRQN